MIFAVNRAGKWTTCDLSALFTWFLLVSDGLAPVGHRKPACDLPRGLFGFFWFPMV